MIDKKVLNGQYYTTSNPFKGNAFDFWNSLRPKNCQILEPFAGSGNLFDFVDGDWQGFDIEPNHEDIIQRDTLKDFPKGFSVCITNPPYLAKNSLSRKLGNKKEDIFFKHEDLYLDCLEKMLDNCDYVAAIIPSTFYGTNLFRERLMCWDKIDASLFSDTAHPAGIAYFGPDRYETKVFVNGKEIDKTKLSSDSGKEKLSLRFNVEDGNYVLNAIDQTSKETIFVEAVSDKFDRKKYLKNTSRNYVLFHSPVELDLEKVNNEISRWRKETLDFELTSFKSLRKDGKYRKRMSFKNLKSILLNLGYTDDRPIQRHYTLYSAD